MPPKMRLEVQHPSTGAWIPAGTIGFERDGSLADNHESGRDLYLFGVNPADNQGYVKKIVDGNDERIGFDEKGRLVSKVAGVEVAAVATLNPNESHEMEVRADFSSTKRKVRFTYSED